MPFANYAELQSEIIDLTHRSDLSAKVPSWIALAETEINAEVRNRLMEVNESLSLALGASMVALPARFIEPIGLWLQISGEPEYPLTYIRQQDLGMYTALSTRPEYWTINGENIEFPNLADQAYTLRFRMLKGFDIASTSTNSLLTSYPAMYLYGALCHAAPYINNDGRIATWRAMYDTTLAKMKRKEGRAKSLVRLRTELPSANRNHTRIFEG